MIIQIEKGLEYRKDDLSKDGFYRLNTEKKIYEEAELVAQRHIDIVDKYLLDYESSELKKAMKATRDEKLNDGMITADGEMWFNERTGIMFMTKLNTYINILGTSFWKSKENETFKWKDKDRKLVYISVSKAKEYSAEILSRLDEVYLSNEEGLTHENS